MLRCLIEKKDCVAVLPTGYGKSLPFQMYLPVKRQLEEEPNDEKEVVCCNLIKIRSNGFPLTPSVNPVLIYTFDV